MWPLQESWGDWWVPSSRHEVDNMLESYQRLSQWQNWVSLFILYRWWSWSSERFQKLTKVAQLELLEPSWKPKSVIPPPPHPSITEDLIRGQQAGNPKRSYIRGPSEKWKTSFDTGNGVRCSSSGVSGTTASMSAGAKHRWWKRKKPEGAGEAAGSQHKPWSEGHREEMVTWPRLGTPPLLESYANAGWGWGRTALLLPSYPLQSPTSVFYALKAWN